MLGKKLYLQRKVNKCELVLLVIKQKLNFLHRGSAVYNKKTKIIWSIWSDHYEAVKELCRLRNEYPEEAFDVMEIY